MVHIYPERDIAVMGFGQIINARAGDAKLSVFSAAELLRILKTWPRYAAEPVFALAKRACR